jgi:N-acetylmuramoyl-L-alanine amidase/putative salt-induced outer membrane protein YdiY
VLSRLSIITASSCFAILGWPLAGSVVLAQPPAPDLRAAEEQLALALTQKDAAAFDRLLASDFVLRGAPDVDRETWIKNAVGLCWGERFEISDVGVRSQTADTAIVSLVLTTFVDPVTCDPAIVRSLLTDVWTRQPDGWRLALRHSGPAGSAVAQQFAKTDPPPPRWERTAELSLVATSGNTDTQTLGAGGSLIFRPGVWVTHARVAYVRSATDGVDTAESLVADVRQSRAISPRVDVYGRGAYLRDRFAGIRHRTTVDAGFGWVAVNEAPHSLKLDAGAGVTHEARLADGSQTFGVGTLGALYRLRVSRTSDLSNQFLFTADLGDAPNWRFQNGLTLTVTMTRVLSLKVGHEVKRINRPVPGFRATDTVLCLLPTAYCLLPAACCLLPAARCPLTAYCLLPTACCLLPAACCLLPTAYCLLPAAYCLLPAACCLLPTACCLLPAACCLLPAAGLAIVDGAPQPPAAAAPYTVLSRDAGRRPLATRSVAGQEMFALDDLARLFNLTVTEDTLAGGLTVTAGKQTILLTPGQSLASVGGRLISLPAPPAREGKAWFVPVEFVSRALGPALGTALELRKPSRLILIGDIRVPRIAGRVEPLAAGARLTLDVAPDTPHTVSQEAQRIVIQFKADALDAALPSSTAPELIRAIRPGDGPAALAIDLGPRFASFRASDAPADRGAGRIVIDVLSSTTTPPTGTDPAAAPTVPAPADPPPLLDLVPPGALRAVVIDPGHGGTETGAHGPGGTLEKDVTLGVARRLKAALEGRLGVRVILTREGDQTVGLDERAAVANNNKADLFISLHANASARPATEGAEVFYLGIDDYEEEAERHRGERVALPVFGGGTRDIEVIPWQMAQVRYNQQSAGFAQAVESALRERVPMSRRALQPAPFRVLVGANMPAVLVEMGFITNAEQERQLASEEFQVAVVQALVASVVRFREARAGATP